MSDEAPAKPTVAQPAQAAAAASADVSAPEPVAPAAEAEAKPTDTEVEVVVEAEAEAAAAPASEDTKAEEEDKPVEKAAETEIEEAKPGAEPETSATAPEPADDEKPSDADIEMKDKTEAAGDVAAEDEKPAETATNAEHEAAVLAAEGAAIEAEGATPGGDKSKARRKSSGVAAKAQKLNKKASKAKILHTDAKPGDHFFAKLKGFPPWPVVVCEEDMLPQNMLNSRPVTAVRPDGTYRDDFADGGKRVADRTFAVMYLHTNEFSWTPNTDLSELDPDTVADLVTTKMRKDLQSAHVLAAEKNNLDYYKNVLREFEEQRLAKIEAKKAKAKTPKKASKAVETVAADEDGDLEMPDVDEDDVAEVVEKKPKSKKRKAEDETSTPQRSESVKKPKIKLTTSSTPKTANGVQSPTPGKDSAKPVKVKAKSAKGGKDAESKKEKEPVAPKEPELTDQEKHTRKEKEILFLRHRLQKGLLLRDQEPKADEMKSMSEFLAKLETFPDLEVSIIRATKINKVLKAILKLENIPKEEEFKFKPRSQALLDKWNFLLATDAGAATPATGAASATANGVNGTSATPSKPEKAATNGVKETIEGKAEPATLEKEAKEEGESKAEALEEEKAAATETKVAAADDAEAKVESAA
ncbi:Uu.00g046250.m01.CDS01 [Anthostomella pinea]|uniref:Uu.00g046250.m01.CDS01 n=1 Tax=Anthostomella pinea TaxID=933095 RepID=A0AAI8VBU7_9PEZI|nr:Uu.00g046250.m01.CDS01 [Anthostomella pinea]